LRFFGLRLDIASHVHERIKPLANAIYGVLKRFKLAGRHCRTFSARRLSRVIASRTGAGSSRKMIAKTESSFASILPSRISRPSTLSVRAASWATSPIRTGVGLFIKVITVGVFIVDDLRKEAGRPKIPFERPALRSTHEDAGQVA
jgi:hypothetical protein